MGHISLYEHPGVGALLKLELIIEALMFLVFKSQEVVECSNSTKL